MERDIFEVVCWPETQLLLEHKDFLKNAVLINSEYLYDEYGPSAYLVRSSWLEEINNKNN